MYEFIVEHADKYVKDPSLAKELQEQAANREKPGYSIPQEAFSEMCRIWVAAYRSGDFPIDVPSLVFPDTVTRFRAINGVRRIGILTSGSREFTQILYNLPLGDGKNLSEFVDEYLLGEEIGDKDNAETFGKLWKDRKGDISAVFDDKVSVCEAAVEGLRKAGAYWTNICLVDRKGQYAKALSEGGELAERIRELQRRRVHLFKNFDEATDLEILTNDIDNN